MRTALAVICFLIAAAMLGYLAVGWGTTLWAQGLTASLTDQTTQPSFPTTVGGLVGGIVALVVGLSALAGRTRK
ncbi:MAG TPA: hypothetical protein VF175_19850 [Lacipirellula sp.]